MIPQRLVEAYLRFVLRYRGSVTIAVALLTAFFAFEMTKMRLHTDFFDFYPKYRTFADAYADCRGQGNGLVGCVVKGITRPGPDPYIQIYTDFRRMFGSANILSVIVETKNGDIYNPETLQKLDRITKKIISLKGVVPYQILSIAHPKVKSITAREGALQIRELFYPAAPKTQADADRVKFAVYSTKGVRGIFTSLDDTAAVVHAGFWEEALDFRNLNESLQALKAEEDDANHTIYITGFPWLYTSVLQYTNQVLLVFLATTAALSFLLFVYFRTWTGVWVPIFSGVLSSIWGLGLAVVLGFNLDPLVLVIPVFLTARALSHSVQSMDRYHEEFYRLHDKQQAIVVSYSALFPPAIASIVTDGIGLLVVAVAPIPLIQKVAIFASFWIISIFISVVTLHPIILTFVRPPREHRKDNLFDTVANALGRRLVMLAVGNMRYVVVATFIATMGFGVYFAHHLRTGDTSPGMALLYPNHPYNVANATANRYFVGNSPLVIIAEGKKPGAIKDAHTLNQLDLFQRYMEQGEGAGGSMTATTMLKTIFRVFHEGDPKWEMLPTRNDHVGQLFFMLTAGTRRGELDRFFSPDYTNATITVFYKNYDHETIKGAIERAKEYIATHTKPDDSVRYRLAGGLFGILAAQIEEVDWSYRVNVPLIFLVVFILSFLTYWSVLGALIVMLPSIVAQPLSEAVMYLVGIDFNINSLPVAAIGIGIGIDYGYYVLSRIVEEYESTRDFDEANRRALTTTGEAVMFTGVTITTSMVLWLFHPLKFEAQMAFLLMMLMVFHAIGALVFIPAMVSLLRPRFATAKSTPQPARLAVEA